MHKPTIPLPTIVNSKIVVLERGILPQGASTKNAGFACFGSLSELIDDMEAHSADEVLELLKKRVEGLKLLRQLLGDDQIGYQAHGGYELFLKKDLELYNSCIDQMNAINSMFQKYRCAQTHNTTPYNCKVNIT